MDPIQGYAADQLLSVQPPPAREEDAPPPVEEKPREPLPEGKGRVIDTLA